MAQQDGLRRMHSASFKALCMQGSPPQDTAWNTMRQVPQMPANRMMPNQTGPRLVDRPWIRSAASSARHAGMGAAPRRPTDHCAKVTDAKLPPLAVQACDPVLGAQQDTRQSQSKSQTLVAPAVPDTPMPDLMRRKGYPPLNVLCRSLPCLCMM